MGGVENERKQEYQHQPLGVPSMRPDSVDLVLSQPLHLDEHVATPPIPQPPLSQEQEALIDLILAKRNVFYTGAAGTGKSHVLRTAVERLRDLKRQVEVVAPTGRAALAVNGTTTWSFAG